MSEVNDMMLKDSKDLLDSVEITTIAAECVKLKEKEAALEAIDGELSRAVKTRGGITYWPGEKITAVSDARSEAMDAKESLERLIQENLDELPALYRTEGGR